MTITELREYAQHKRTEARMLAERYSGVRPGWVSTDIALALNTAERFEAAAERLEGRK